MPCGRKIGPFDCCSVVQGDCLELLKQLPDGCVDVVLTDPPWGISGGKGTINKQRAPLQGVYLGEVWFSNLGRPASFFISSLACCEPDGVELAARGSQLEARG
jgi:hypothetical protein